MIKSRVAIIIPIYKQVFEEHEFLSLTSTFYHLGYRDDLYWIGPNGFDFKALDRKFGKRKYKEFPEKAFESIEDYSRLLLSKKFYESFSHQYSHILIIQPDATVLKDELDFWVNQPYYYIGAPWPNGWSYPLPGINGADELRCSTLVGNGGFSLRALEPVMNLIDEFPVAHRYWFERGFPEDFYLGLASSVSSFFLVPNIRVASKFAVELEPDFFYSLNMDIPFGLHAWHRYDPLGWSQVIKKNMGQ